MCERACVSVRVCACVRVRIRDKSSPRYAPLSPPPPRRDGVMARVPAVCSAPARRRCRPEVLSPASPQASSSIPLPGPSWESSRGGGGGGVRVFADGFPSSLAACFISPAANGGVMRPASCRAANDGGASRTRCCGLARSARTHTSGLFPLSSRAGQRRAEMPRQGKKGPQVPAECCREKKRPRLRPLPLTLSCPMVGLDDGLPRLSFAPGQSTPADQLEARQSRRVESRERPLASRPGQERVARQHPPPPCVQPATGSPSVLCQAQAAAYGPTEPCFPSRYPQGTDTTVLGDGEPTRRAWRPARAVRCRGLDGQPRLASRRHSQGARAYVELESSIGRLP